jgi:hypothetical protein
MEEVLGPPGKKEGNECGPGGGFEEGDSTGSGFWYGIHFR